MDSHNFNSKSNVANFYLILSDWVRHDDKMYNNKMYKNNINNCPLFFNLQDQLSL